MNIQNFKDDINLGKIVLIKLDTMGEIDQVFDWYPGYLKLDNNIFPAVSVKSETGYFRSRFYDNDYNEVIHEGHYRSTYDKLPFTQLINYLNDNGINYDNLTVLHLNELQKITKSSNYFECKYYGGDEYRLDYISLYDLDKFIKRYKQ